MLVVPSSLLAEKLHGNGASREYRDLLLSRVPRLSLKHAMPGCSHFIKGAIPLIAPTSIGGYGDLADTTAQDMPHHGMPRFMIGIERLMPGGTIYLVVRVLLLAHRIP